MESIVTRILDKKNIKYEIRLHTRKVYTSVEAAHERGVNLDQIVKCMIVKTPNDIYVLALLPGNRNLDAKLLSSYLNVKKVEIAKKEDVERITGYRIGAISPIGFKKQLKTVMDKKILNNEFITISAGRPDAGLYLKVKDLVLIINPEFSFISKE